jgi:mannose-6-phosphate isomerase-like protein (cupin superfamily)
MASRQAVNLQQSYVHLRPRGAADVLVKTGVGVTTGGDATIVWDPEVEGLLASEADMAMSSRHRGERHLDADELVYLVAGAARLVFDDQGDPEEVALHPGDAVVVPRGIWHRVLIDERSRLLFFNAGRTEVRVR